MNLSRRLSTVAAVAAVALASLLSTSPPAQAQSPSWLSSGVIYCVNPEIFSTSGLSGVTSQLTRIHNLGCNIIWLMPFYTRGVACTVDGISHPSVNSPYCINNMEGIASNMGTSSDLTNLVTTAHGLGMKVILDVALNQTSWDNPLVTSNPGYYLHSDGNPNNVASIEDGWGTDTDIAQFNLTTNEYGVQTYVTDVCTYWVQNYNIDGFRFDSADDPSGSSRSLPASLASSILSACQAINPNVMLLGEEEDVSLALAPYDLDYGWNMWFYGVVPAFTTSDDESTLQYQWEYPYTISNTSPATMLHMNVQDDWDYANRDNVTLGGYAQAMAAGAWDFTISGVPLMYNGMEVANTNGGENSHTQIDWTGTDSAAFTTFYTQLLALRNDGSGALQQGSTSFITTSSSAVIAYERTSGSVSYVIEINTNGGAASGTLTSQSGTWTEVTPTGAPGGKSHELPSTGDFSLQGYDFAIFKKGSSSPPAAPTSLTATAGNAQVALSWTGSGGATSYNVYRGTSSGGESSTPVATGITSTSYTNTGLTNGTEYYFKVAAVDSAGISAESSEASATPAAPTVPAAPTGLAATPGNAQVGLSWTASSGATSYNVYRGTSSGGESSTAIATGITSTSYTNTGLTNGTKYYFKIAAVNSAGTSAESSEASATPSVAIPPAPTGLSASAGNGQVSLTWSSSSGATSYDIYRGTSSGGESSTPITTGLTSTSYTNTGLTNGTTYYYKVSAVNAGGTSPESSEASATPESTAGGSLSGSVTTYTTGTDFNLTSIGTTDWAAWGFSSGGIDRDASGGSKISNASTYGGGSMNDFNSSFLEFSWTNGTPDTSSNSTEGFYNSGGVGDGFQVTVPAGTSSQNVTIWIGGWETAGTLTATLSDNSATAYSNSTLSSTSGSYYGSYLLTFRAASANQTLTLVWKEKSGTGNVTLYAVALH